MCNNIQNARILCDGQNVDLLKRNRLKIIVLIDNAFVLQVNEEIDLDHRHYMKINTLTIGLLNIDYE